MIFINYVNYSIIGEQSKRKGQKMRDFLFTLPSFCCIVEFMKVKCSIQLKYNKKSNIWILLAVILSLLLWKTAHISIMAVPIFMAVLTVIMNLEITLDERLSWLWTGILFGVGSILTMYSVQYLLLEQELFRKTSFDKLKLNILCVLVIYLLVQMITNNTAITCIVSHGFFLILGFIDYFVYLFRQNEFSFADLRSIGTGLSVAGNYQLQLHDRGAYVILAAVLFFAVAVKSNVVFQQAIPMRIISCMLGILCGLLVYYESYDYSTETWEQKGTYRNGYILNFVLGIRDSFVSPPDNYSKEFIQKLEMHYKDDDGTLSTSEEPVIIAIMNESFADLSVLGEMETNAPLTPFMDSLEENTVKGYALSSVFGAKTPNSEWEFMTGNSMAFLPEGSVVYQQYISKKPTSLVSTLKNLGYTCVAMHPYYETGWSRNEIYPTLGFDEMFFIDDFDKEQLIREYISDEELYDKIIERYESSPANERLFIMGITMQNHGGYTKSYENFQENYYKIGRSYTDANQYFSLIRESDKALEKLITYFEQVDQPVEIVFFGDHQPSLSLGFYPILNGKGLSGLTMEELEALYTVPFFIWTNYDSEENTVPITSLNFLSTMALKQAGIELPAYNQFLTDFMEIIPAINSKGYYSKEKGTYCYIEDAVGEEAQWLDLYENLQYNSMFDKKNQSTVFFPYLE